jgi:hypothetical protein
MAVPTFQSTNIPTNTDKSSMTSDERSQFAATHPAALNTKHQTTIKNITDLQQIEQYMFQNLQALNKSSPDSVQQSDVIKQRLNELSTMRMALFTQLKSMYADTQSQTADSRSNLADQITMTNVVENELTNAKNELKALEQERLNKKRLVELGEYEYDRYTSHKNIIKVIAYGALGVLIFVFLMGQKWFPSALGFGGICLIIAVVIITIVGRMLVNFSRSNLNWNKFDYAGVPGGGDGGEPKKEFDFWGMFSDTCANIESSVKSAKDSVLNIKDKAVAAGKMNVNLVEAESEPTHPHSSAPGEHNRVDVDSFINRVNPSQPKGHEHFHTIF